MRMPFAFTFSAASGMTLYLDAAAGVTAAVLVGRYLEARARGRSASALTALAALGAKSVAVLRDGTERRVPVGELSAGGRDRARAGRRRQRARPLPGSPAPVTGCHAVAEGATGEATADRHGSRAVRSQGHGFAVATVRPRPMAAAIAVHAVFRGVPAGRFSARFSA